MTQTAYEKCSCGAEIDLGLGDYANLSGHLKEWRENHRHESPYESEGEHPSEDWPYDTPEVHERSVDEQLNDQIQQQATELFQLMQRETERLKRATEYEEQLAKLEVREVCVECETIGSPSCSEHGLASARVQEELAKLELDADRIRRMQGMKKIREDLSAAGMTPRRSEESDANEDTSWPVRHG